MKKRILFLAEGITMTHFVRPAALAASLDPTEWDVYFCSPSRYHTLCSPSVRNIGELRTLDPGQFMDRLAKGRILYDETTLRSYVQDDLDIIKAVNPDLIIGDSRFSLCISAPLAGVPYASIFNAQWSPYANQPAVTPELPLTRWVSPKILDRIFSMTQPLFYRHHAKPYHRIQKSYRVPVLPGDIRHVYTAGDLVLYADVPGFVPMTRRPAHHRFVGICPWTTPTPKPTWWNEVINSSLPKIFVSMGSSGALHVLPAILKAAASLPVKVVLATSGKSVGPLPENVYTASLLPYEEMARHSAVVVSQGGTAGVYLAMAAGTPSLAIPGNVDTHLSTVHMEKNGVGLGVRSEYATAEKLRLTLQRLMVESRFKQASEMWAGRIAHHDTKIVFPSLLRTWFAQGQPAPRQDVETAHPETLLAK